MLSGFCEIIIDGCELSGYCCGLVIYCVEFVDLMVFICFSYSRFVVVAFCTISSDGVFGIKYKFLNC